ncbi:Protein of uncharacterised function (DUF2637) [Mycobacteroides abscessus subsp. abscessus]|uniref:helix-turn-helix domain-containing protein n=1 Tax=Mycobacteroides abscessus TaxID=36809 RepID=UPI0009A62858|nr:helix-turn-helix domain-containing protein [Mycobacteroides abscessus]SKR41443.1 Protein of uncharacterised function (DUF2637) [Mycobacteroides abscessus subsp. abscessus]
MIPTPEALRHRAATRRWARAGLFGFTAASVAFNVAVVRRRPDVIPDDIWAAGLVPVVLAVTAHIIAKFLQSGLRASGIARSMYVAGIVAVGMIATAAFVISFENLTDLMYRQHHLAVAMAFPVMLDLAIVVCTGILVVIGIADENDQDAGVSPHRGWLARRFGWWNTAAQTPPVAVPQPAAHVEQNAASAAEQPSDLATQAPAQLDVPRARVADHDVVSHAEQDLEVVAVQRGTQPAEQAVTWGVSRDAGDVPTEPIPVPHHVEVAAQPAVSREAKAAVAVELPTASRETEPVETAERPVEQLTVSRAAEADYTAEQDDEFARLAQRLVAAGRTQASVGMAAAVLRGADRGVTVRELADATGMSPSAASRLTKAARELEAELATTGS